MTFCRWCGAWAAAPPDFLLCPDCEPHRAELEALDRAERREQAAAVHGPLFADLYVDPPEEA